MDIWNLADYVSYAMFRAYLCSVQSLIVTDDFSNCVNISSYALHTIWFHCQWLHICMFSHYCFRFTSLKRSKWLFVLSVNDISSQDLSHFCRSSFTSVLIILLDPWPEKSLACNYKPSECHNLSFTVSVKYVHRCSSFVFFRSMYVRLCTALMPLLYVQ